MRIGFIGLGKLGMPCAEVIAKKGHEVEGYDINLTKSKFFDTVKNIELVVKNKEIVFVAVPTPHDKNYDGSTPVAHLQSKDFSYDVVKEVLAEANKWMGKNQLLVLISTVLPGTVRRELIEFTTNTEFIYNPYLIAMGSVAWDMVNPEMVMIGTQNGSITGIAKRLSEFYESMMENNPRYVVGTWDECECIKIFYNTFISAKLSLVNMIQDVAESQGNINVDIVTDALAKSSQRIMGPQYMTAGMGDGGACHPRDNIALRWMSDNLNLGYDLFDSIMNAREIQAENLAKKLVELSKGSNLQIVIHGKAYKPKVPFCDGSYSVLVGYYCKQLGCKPTYVDPCTGDIFQPKEPCVFLLAHRSTVTYKYLKQAEKDDLYCIIPDGSIVVDPWRSYQNSKCTVVHYGNTRLNV
jgi:UDPglucose 6-dehydrogenase|tara:strand:- start:21757 stop:22983 length:1227 start_codon:yes stop_codon:yes gene_type:complete